jgi:ParB family transcriptional regulator, chromosome partitioning protein
LPSRALKQAPKPMEASLSRLLGTKVRLKGGPTKGRIQIEYYSQEELTRLIELLSSGQSV